MVQPLPTTNLHLEEPDQHKGWHTAIHTVTNLWTPATVLTGDALVAGADGPDPAIEAHQSTYWHDSQYLTHNHTVPGPLTIAFQRHHRSVKINVSAAITGTAITGLETQGNFFSEVPALLVGVAAATIDLTGGVFITGTVPASIAIGEQHPFRIQRWV